MKRERGQERRSDTYRQTDRDTSDTKTERWDLLCRCRQSDPVALTAALALSSLAYVTTAHLPTTHQHTSSLSKQAVSLFKANKCSSSYWVAYNERKIQCTYKYTTQSIHICL